MSSTGLIDFIMSSTGVMYLSDYQNSKVWKCTGASSTGTGTCTDLGLGSGVTIGAYNKIALDPTETYIYVRDTVNTQIVKCAISTGACSVYLQSTTTIGYDLSNTAITLASFSSSTATIATITPATWGIAADSSGSVYFYLGDIYKCTAADTCSLLLNGRGINPGSDDFVTSLSFYHNNCGLKIDSSGFLYFSSNIAGLTRFGTGAVATSSSSFSLNEKMVSSYHYYYHHYYYHYYCQVWHHRTGAVSIRSNLCMWLSIC